MTWQNKPTDFIKTAIDDCETHVKKIAMVGLQSVVMGSPVMDGAYRGNHRLTLNNTDESFDLKTQDKSGGATIEKNKAELVSFKLGDTLYLQNNAPYAVAIENGHSKNQAPKGVYSIAFQNMSSF